MYFSAFLVIEFMLIQGAAAGARKGQTPHQLAILQALIKPLVSMNDVRKVSRVILLVGAVFACNKFLIRPFVLANGFPEIINVIVLSLPNLCEAIIGALLLTNIGLFLRYKYLKAYRGLKEYHVYIIAVVAATIYVSLQELKIHNLGGRNVYDPFDLLFSIIGIAVAYVLLVYLKPRIYLEQEN